jgi:hypothetical protein
MKRASSKSEAPGSDRERRERVAERVRGSVVEPGRADGGVPNVSAPVVQVQVAAPFAGEDERSVDPGGKLGERDRRPGRQGDGSERPRLLPVRLHLAIREDAADAKKPGGPVDVPAFQRDPLLRPEPGQPGDDRDERKVCGRRIDVLPERARVDMEAAAFVLLLAAIGFGGFFLSLRRAPLRVLVGGGIAVPLAVFVAAFLSADEERGQCSDCGLYLGRYWEPWVVAFVAVLYALVYWSAVLVGKGIRSRPRPR